MQIALDSARLAEHFAAQGLREAGFNAKLRAYVPERRAVLEITSPGAGGERVFVKVLPPDEARQIVALHERFAGVVPVPEARLVDPSGVVVVRTVDGTTLLETLKQDPDRAPAPDEVVAISSAIARMSLDRDCQTAAERVLARVQRSLDAVLPEETRRVRRIVAAIKPLEPQTRVAVHGDFHPKQLLVADGVFSGVLDLDEAGMGAQADDLAMQLGWLAVVADERDAPAVSSYLAGMHDAACAVVDPAELRVRTAITLLMRSLGPYQRAARDWKPRALGRIALAERWSAAA
jgi:Phosphotransferase enzyme family